MLGVIIAYLIGSIPFGYLIVRASGGGDVRQTGSGGTGATNVSRRAGKAAGIITLILDALKGVLAVIIVRSMWNADWLIAVAAVAVIAGHIFPVWLRFRGGKGVATGAGVFLALSPMAVLFAGLVFVAMVWWRKMISLGSIAGTLAIPVYFWFVETSIPIFIGALVCAGLIVYAHRGNIARIWNGTEPRISI